MSPSRFVSVLVALAAALLVLLLAAGARADESIFDPSRDKLHLDSFDLALTGYSQRGNGYQSQAGPPGGPGSQALTVWEPMGYFVLKKGQKLTIRILAPFDMVTAASPNAIDKTRTDTISQASRQNEAGSIDTSVTYDVSKRTTGTFRGGIHLEEDFRSWNMGLAGTRSFAEDNTTIAAGANQIYDWFDRFDYRGLRHARTQRGTTSGFVSLTQILSPTTVGYLNYGLTEQNGELGNTWNAVPLVSNNYGGEVLPQHRLRHAFVARLAQWLPWNGALKGFYRMYADDWGIVAHTVEGQLYQRFSALFYARVSYRFHTQRGVDFFRTVAFDDGNFRTADSDLQSFDAHSIGLSGTFTVPQRRIKGLEMQAAYERYFRTNDLDVNVFTWRTGFRF